MKLTIRALAICVAVAAAMPAAPAGTNEMPGPGGTVAMARALGIETAPERPRFLTEIVRIVYDTQESKTAETETKLAVLAGYVDAINRLQAALAAFPRAASGFARASAAGNPARGEGVFARRRLRAS